MTYERRWTLLAALDMLGHYAMRGRRTKSEIRAIDGALSAIGTALGKHVARPTRQPTER